MGGAKRFYEEMTGGGLNLFAALNKWVCGKCLNESDIRDFIKANAVEKECSFCHRKSRKPIAAEFAEVVKFIDRGLTREYGDPSNEGVGWDGREGGWQGATTCDTWDLLLDEVQLDLPISGGPDSLLPTLSRALGDREWCDRNPYSLSPHAYLKWSYDRFCDFIKHERRYFFVDAGKRTSKPLYPDEEPLEPAKMLAQLAQLCAKHDLIRRIDVGTSVVRARQQASGKLYTTAAALGPPPKEYATQANRMSAAGIPIFYGATDVATAIAETKRGRRKDYAIGTFVLTRPIWILDLSAVPSVPGLFCPDDEPAARRSDLIFLNRFAREVSKPIARDRAIHIDYVPTQVITEHFRVTVKRGDEPIMGVMYKSAQKTSGKCIAIFAEQDDVADAANPGDALLVLNKVDVVTK